ncbi:hypothetical protein [Knoellia koreensis]|uniref:Uncharacterized protein n=1 Tax=Knoellia koreensis TaxID=2730921 RepID=A0A849HBW9_9MICO|nr:hypothetical protein [Knoellia sp. DB2414S]NNM44549.1 hypothetical protein [Knoellia sp. DB2414S]
MTDRDLTGLLERASADLPEVDFASDAWADAYAAQSRRRRRLTTGVGAVAAAALAVGAVQIWGSDGSANRTPTPGVTATTPPVTGTLADGTAYAELPLEGKESELPQLDVGLPKLIDTSRPRMMQSALRGEPPTVVGVTLEPTTPELKAYRVLLIRPSGELLEVDGLTLKPVRDTGGNEAMPLGTRTIGGGGMVAFPQPGEVVVVDRRGEVTRFPVPSEYVQEVSWTPSNDSVVIRSDDGKVWTLDPWKPGAKAVEVVDTLATGVTGLRVAEENRSLSVTWNDLVTGKRAGQRTIGAPVYELWQRPVGSATWVASGAFFDQALTSEVIRRGNGPIYQGVVAVPLERGKAKLLLAPENPDGQEGRYKGCCTPLAWWNASTVLLQTNGSHPSWILAWNVDTGQVSKVTRIAYDPKTDVAPPRLALNIGWRY